MKMRNFSISISVSAFVVASLCVASVAMADLARVNIVMDISDPDNVTITDYEENGTYGGAYFGLDGLECYGAVSVTPHTGPITFRYPDGFFLNIDGGDGWFYSLTTETAWMVYGVEYNMNGSPGYSGSVHFSSSDPDDFYCVDGEDIYPRSFIVVDASDNNGLGGGKFLGTIIPEPASMGLLAFGALAIIRRRRS